MSFLDLLKIEFMKVKRSKIVPLIFIAPLLVVVSGVASLSNYFTPEYTNAWPAMFIQSALVYAYYLLPFSMIVVCVMIAGRETGNNGILKMLALPVSRCALSIAKFCVLTFYLFMEMVAFLVVFVIAGLIATQTMGVTETLPILYLLKWCLGLFLTMLPCIAAMWAITVLFEKPLLSVGLNLHASFRKPCNHTHTRPDCDQTCIKQTTRTFVTGIYTDRSKQKHTAASQQNHTHKCFSRNIRK
jgi:lantibiotic transport system permease protein